MDYQPPIITKPIDVYCTKGSDAYGLTLTMPKGQTRTDENTTRIFGLQMLQLWIEGCHATAQEIRVVDLDYYFGHYARTMHG